MTVSLGDRIRLARNACYLTQAELAELVASTQQTIDRIERGVTKHSRVIPTVLQVLNLPKDLFVQDRSGARQQSKRTSKGVGRPLDRRNLFAAMAMQGLLATCHNGNHDPMNIAYWAVRNADALVAELNKEPS